MLDEHKLKALGYKTFYDSLNEVLSRLDLSYSTHLNTFQLKAQYQHCFSYALCTNILDGMVYFKLHKIAPNLMLMMLIGNVKNF